MTSQFNSPGPTPANPSLSNRWQDWANAILGIWLFISPWVLGFGMGTLNTVAGGGAPGAPPAGGGAGGMVGNAAWNAWILGAIIFLVSISALSRMEFWQERINGLLGIWVFIAPWVLGFTGLTRAAWDHWVVGVLVFLVAMYSIAMAQRRPGYTQAYAGDKPPYAGDKTRPPL